MNDLDETLRSGLRASTEGIGQINGEELSELLHARAAARAADLADRPSRARAIAIAAAVALLASVSGLAAYRLTSDNQRDVATDGPAAAGPGFDGWGPGWHLLDTGPVPMGGPASMAFLDGRLYVARLVTSDGDESYRPRSGLWSFDPATDTWATHPEPPVEDVHIVATDSELVAVGGPGSTGPGPLDRLLTWATWSPGDAQWTTHGAVPIAEELRQAGTTGPTPPTTDWSLVWTGRVVIDFTSGAVLDPADGAATPLEFPAEVVRYSHLRQATPVWTGSTVVAASWSTRPALAWDESGRLLGEIPGPPMADPEYALSAAAVSVAGEVVLLARDATSGGARAARYDPTSDEWSEVAAPDPTEPWCPYLAAAVGDSVVSRGCRHDDTRDRTEDTSPQLLEGDAWSTLADPPRREQGIERWLGTEQALVTWVSDDDSMNNPQAPFRWAAVWIPPGEPAPRIEPTQFGACGRLFVYAVTEDQSAAITFHFAGLGAGDHQQTYTLPDPAVNVEVVTGQQVDNPLCNDLLGHDYRLDRARAVSAGTLHLSVAGRDVTLTVEGLALDGGPDIQLDHITTPIGTLGG